MMETRSILRTSAALGLALAAMGLADRAEAQDCSVKVGAVLPTSVDWGRPIAETAQWVVDQVNEAGGVNDCQVEMILRDTQVDPKVGVDAAKALVDLDGVPLLLGAVSSGVSMPILTSVTVPAGVMQMSCCSSSTAFTALSEEGKTDGLWFRTFATTGVQAAVGAKVAQDQGWKKVAIFYKNDDWGQDIGKLVASDLEALGIEVTASVAINDAQPSYRAEAASALSAQPDAIYLALYPNEGTAAVREWISLGGTQNMILANSLKSDEFRENVGMDYLANAWGTDTASPRADSATAFVDAFEARFDGPPNGPGLANSYDATMIGLLAMEAAGKDASGAEIAAAIPRVTDPEGTPITADGAGFTQASQIFADGGSVMYQGATGNVRFDPNGDVSAPAVVWKFGEDGIDEVEYLSLDDVDAFMASLKD
ncbi:Leucine-, isoleucine-, valine-, threonine-, and alanine-binding protein precursor [Roseivivax sp. THAF40]|uniref:ABC transporter substrate-binding protein n=1 Tax=unclassified Roseivivax TaxID=2639302 RepID=UPI0012AA080E|nr:MULTISPECIES: ABC transporter substrate-binding protein [unclassified Roseivivax]QFS83564.1 Leucine-, isoleucine-, valine-, threonine-, and alanine-binding protein precursor [Roseivivax sp. THAF197b]QFT47309.1 Leucine-, isoleucine-, valine-, threonine-, and alanine-binding protein precursor [Roseivivax sp. THAF40]